MTLTFSRRVSEGMRKSGLTLRSFCREVGVDPSFFSKVLSGKRSPPSEEEVLRRIAGRLSLDAAELIVSAGRIPAEWRAVLQDPDLFRDMNSLAVGLGPRPRLAASPTPKAKLPSPKAEPRHAIVPAPRQEMSEELL